jgi:hypothetical protein
MSWDDVEYHLSTERTRTAVAQKILIHDCLIQAFASVVILSLYVCRLEGC